MAKRVYHGRRSRWKVWAAAVPAVLVLAAGGWALWSALRPAPTQQAPMVALHESKQIEPDSQAPDSSESLEPDSSASGEGSLSAPDEGQPGKELQEVYDFTQPAPETEAVDNSYFEDAAFVGDSRTDGFLIYSGIGCGENLTSNGLSIFKLAEKKALTIGDQEYTLLEALGLKEYGKVYLSLGVNELGYYDDQGFYESYLEAIDAIRELQPDAVIYIQGLIPLNEQRIAETTGRSYLTNEHLRIYNDLMRQAAQEKQVVFLDLYSAFADENGSLPYAASNDGVHLSKAYCQQWLAYLQTHTVDPAALEAGRAEAQLQSQTGQVQQ